MLIQHSEHFRILFSLFLKIVFIYLFLALLALHHSEGFSLVTASRGYSSSQRVSFSLQRLLLLQSSGCRTLIIRRNQDWACLSFRTDDTRIKRTHGEEVTA